MTNNRRFSSDRGSGQRPQAGSVAWHDAFDIRLLGTDANACCEVIRFDLNERRFNIAASLDGVSAASMKSAAARRIDRRGDIAFQYDTTALCFELRIGNRNGGNQRLCIR